MKALSLAQQAAKRIPLVDSLIAAVACLKKATLLHRDQHFNPLPSRFLKPKACSMIFKALSEPCGVAKKDSTGKLGPPEFHKAKAIA